jgi:hypothetical protein
VVAGSILFYLVAVPLLFPVMGGSITV